MNADDLPRTKDGLALLGTALAPTLSLLLASGGASPETANLVGVLLTQVLPASWMYSREHGGREGREQRRVRQVLQELGGLLAQETHDPLSLEDFTARYPLIVELMELTLRRAAEDVRQNDAAARARQYARILRDCLLHPAAMDVRAVEVEGMIDALANLNAVDLRLLQAVTQLTTRPHGIVPVDGGKLMSRIDAQGQLSGGFLQGRLARLVAMGLLEERAKELYDGPAHYAAPYHSNGRTFVETPFGYAFRVYCLDLDQCFPSFL